jgi:hypothetical protein
MKADKRFIVRKYVMAPTAAEAIKREGTQPVDEVYLESLDSPKGTADGIGFHAYQEPQWRADEVIARRKR